MITAHKKRMPPIVVVAADSFKGSLDARAASQAMAEGIAVARPDAELRLRPMADGGEGTLDAIVAASPGSRRRTIVTRGASGAALEADVATLPGGEGVIEVAAIVGLTDPAATATGVHRRDTRGVGIAIRTLLDEGCRAIAIGLGGSSTNDGGAGMLAALGLRFLDAAGHEIAPTPEGLAQLARVDAGALDRRLAATRITVMSDVDNPLNGPRGATAVFGPQKGVAAHDVDATDRTLAHHAALVEAALGRRAAHLPGAGAAGGLGFALQALGARHASGAAIVADLNGLDAALAGADWAIAGEGRSDAQTAMHKAPWVVATRARAQRVPVSLLSGAVDPAARTVLDAAFDGCFALPPGPATLDESIAHAREWLAARAFAMARLYFSARR
jgi:glycerate kinase